MSVRRRRPSARSEGGPRGIVTLAGWLALLLSALFFVTWRQTRGVEMERVLGELESERGVVEAERVAVQRRIEELRSRGRIVRLARERLGMHLAEDHEIVFLPEAASRMVGAEP